VRCYLAGADLTSADLSDADLPGPHLTETDLGGTCLVAAKLLDRTYRRSPDLF
jgi:uncharacterized protein YjbI with pentapeptide repeats